MQPERLFDTVLVYTWNSEIYPHIPYSVIFLAASLKKAGFRVLLHDTALDPISKLDRIECHTVGISTITSPGISGGIRVIEKLNRKNKGMIKIWGGVHPTALTQQTLQSKYADIVVRGEGEETMVELLNTLNTNGPLEDVAGVAYKRRGEGLIIENRPQPLYDLNKNNFADVVPLIDERKYFGIKKQFYYESSRGCPYACRFCSFNIQKKWRAKSVDIVIADLNLIKNKFNPEVINFVDPEFFVSIKRIEEFAQELIKNNLQIKWWGSCRIDHFNRFEEKFIKLIKRSGCFKLNFGAETGSDKVLTHINKKINRADIVELAKKTKKYGMEAQLSFMCGFPTEDKADFNETLYLIDVIKGINPDIDIVGLNIFVPLPGSDMFEEAKQYGFLPPSTLKDWGRDNLSISKTLWFAPWLSKERKRELQSFSTMIRFFYYYYYFNKLDKDVLVRMLKINLLRYPIRIFLGLLNRIFTLRWNKRLLALPIDIKAFQFFQRAILRHM